MEIQYFGANCIKIIMKKATLVFDDNLKSLAGKSVTKESDISLVSNEKVVATSAEGRLHITYPGEYEVSNISILGIAARGHMDTEKDKNAVIYKVVAEDIRIAIVGHIHVDLDETQLEQLATVDVLVMPVGNSGYTLDAADALKIIRKVEPSVVIPTHYDDKNLKYEVPQLPLAQALKELSMEPVEPVQGYKIKAADIPDIMKLVVLERNG